ncbi:SPFH domain-containing protein [Brevundimonas variabilis]|uniref:Regulator of protease activity HflC (Stomatin/prohibitin superfamily) n=1 Tax=Brevundimonas variabilis TaxID=74312 RepID=A0A7W9FEB4_9CAUL|nr:SPFH domain-containing protein [Brevundimonas variabilis]MBB5746142.1 regulator of protease activity HflC (stomatin/prohibitin superfamily) [Brevundimonas variabilis]
MTVRPSRALRMPSGGGSVGRVIGLVFTIILLVLIMTLSVSSCSVTVESGYVGIKTTKFGATPGVQPQELGPGFHWEGIGEKIRTYQTLQRTYSYTREPNSDGGENEEITFSDVLGLPMTADVALTFRIREDKAADLYATWRQEFDAFIDGPLRTSVRAAIARETEKLPVACNAQQASEAVAAVPATDAAPIVPGTPDAQDCPGQLIGPGRQIVLQKAMQALQREWSPQGLEIIRMEWVGSIRYPESVLQAIQSRTTAEQNTRAAIERVNLERANADARIAQARGQAEANRLLAESIRSNPEVVRLREIERTLGLCPLNANTCVIGQGVNLSTLIESRNAQNEGNR